MWRTVACRDCRRPAGQKCRDPSGRRMAWNHDLRNKDFAKLDAVTLLAARLTVDEEET